MSIELQPQVRTLSATEAASIQIVDSGAGSGTAQWLVPSSMALSNGQVLIVQGAPYKVTAVQTQADGLKVSIQRPSLQEIFVSGHAKGTVDVSTLQSSTAAPAGTKAHTLAASSTWADTSMKPAATQSQSLSFPIPVDTGMLKGTLTATVTGSIDVDWDFSAISGLKSAKAVFTGDVALTGNLDFKAGAKGTLAKRTLDTPCATFTIGPVPASVCFPVQFALNASADVDGTVPVKFSQHLVAGRAYPDDASVPAATVQPDKTKPSISGLNLNTLKPCTTITFALAPTVGIEPTFVVLKVFKVAALPSSLALNTTLKLRLDPRQQTPTLVDDVSSTLDAKIEGKIGMWLEMDSAKEITKATANDFLGKLLDKAAAETFVTSATLLDKSFPLIDSAPLPACIKVAEKPVEASGAPITTSMDDASVDPSVKTSWVITPPGGKATAPSVGSQDTLMATTPGNYTIQLTQTDPNGNSTVSEMPYLLMPAGRYVGVYDGADWGTVSAQIDAAGNISGSGSSLRSGESGAGTGKVSSAGVFTLSGFTSSGAVFTGAFTPSANGWIISGSWSGAGGGSGSFRLLQQP